MRLGVPIMVTVWVNMGMSVTDAWMVSRLGPDALAAVAVGSDSYSIVYYFFGGVLAGLAPALAAAVADGTISRVREVWTASWIGGLVCLLPAVPAVWFAPVYLEFVGVPRELLDGGAVYTRCMALTLVPMLAIGIVRSMLTAQHRPRVFLHVTLCALPLNALLDALLIHGIGPFGGFGVGGAGAATLLTACSIALALLVQLSRQDFAATGVLRPCRARWTDGLDLLRVGVPIGVTTLAEIGVYFAATLYLASVSVEAAAAHTLTMKLAGVAYALPLALSQVATVRMAQASRPADALRVVRTQLQLALIGGVVLCTAVALLAAPVAALLDDGSALGGRSADTAYGLLLLLAATELIEPFTVTASGLLRGRRDTFVPMLIGITAYWLFSTPLALWLAPRVEDGAAAVWTSLLLGMLLTAGLLAWRLRDRLLPGVSQE